MVQIWFWGYGSTVWSIMANHSLPCLTTLFTIVITMAKPYPQNMVLFMVFLVGKFLSSSFTRVADVYLVDRGSGQLPRLVYRPSFCHLSPKGRFQNGHSPSPVPMERSAIQHHLCTVRRSSNNV